MMLKRHVPNSSDDLQRNPLGVQKSSMGANVTTKLAILPVQSAEHSYGSDLYPAIDNPLDVFLPGPCRNAHRVVLAKTHAPSSYWHPKHVRIQIVQPVGRGLSTVERLPATHDILHLVRPGRLYFHSQRLRPMRRSITVGYNPLWKCGPRQPGPHKL